MADKRNYRVLIQVADQEVTEETSNGATGPSLRTKFPSAGSAYSPRLPSHGCYTEVDVMNCTTLSVSKKDSQNKTRSRETMYFDCVAAKDGDPFVRTELSNLFDSLLIDQQNCCLCNFKCLREGPSNFFNSILIPEIDRRIMLLRSTVALQSIKLEYYDVQKYDVVNMFSKPRYIASNSGTKGAMGEMIFRNTRQLLRWSQHAFVSLWAGGSEHDSFELEFVFIDAPSELDGTPMGNRMTKVRLSILQFYMCKMDPPMRVGLQQFFENIHHNQRINQSIITDYLREYFMSKRDSWSIWVLFDVPQINYGCTYVSDMLGIANAAFKGVREDKMETESFVEDVLFSTPNAKAELPRQAGGVNYPSTHKRFPNITSSFPLHIPNMKMDNYSPSFWHSQINETASSVIDAMEKYYERKFDLKIRKICNDIKNASRPIDKELLLPNMPSNLIEDRCLDDDDALRTHSRQYREALCAFRMLSRKVEKGKSDEQLSEFVKLKNEEISKQTHEMKVKMLELCQSQISNAIKDEVAVLRNEILSLD